MCAGVVCVSSTGLYVCFTHAWVCVLCVSCVTVHLFDKVWSRSIAQALVTGDWKRSQDMLCADSGFLKVRKRSILLLFPFPIRSLVAGGCADNARHFYIFYHVRDDGFL